VLFLAIANEGTDVARWLNQKGVTVFILKYRLAHSLTDNHGQELSGKLTVQAKMFVEPGLLRCCQMPGLRPALP